MKQIERWITGDWFLRNKTKNMEKPERSNAYFYVLGSE